MSGSIRIDWEDLRELEYDHFSYQIFVPVGSRLLHPAINVQVVNNTDRTIYLSNDGVNAKWLLPSKGYFTLDVQSNKGVNEAGFAPAGTTFYVKSKTTIPTTGEVVISVMHLTR